MNTIEYNNKLFKRVVDILEQARSNVLRTVNNQMVLAYWHIGREIVEEIQSGDERADYGKQIIENLSEQLQGKYKRGYSVTNLKYFRRFYLAYNQRISEIRHIGCDESDQNQILHIESGESVQATIRHIESGELDDSKKGFSPELGWSHYRTLMQVENKYEQLFYEIEAENEHWDVQQLETHINHFLFARILKSKDKNALMKLANEGHHVKNPADIIKSPLILDFLGVPEARRDRSAGWSDLSAVGLPKAEAEPRA